MTYQMTANILERIYVIGTLGKLYGLCIVQHLC